MMVNICQQLTVIEPAIAVSVMVITIRTSLGVLVHRNAPPTSHFCLNGE